MCAHPCERCGWVCVRRETQRWNIRVYQFIFEWQTIAENAKRIVYLILVAQHLVEGVYVIQLCRLTAFISKSYKRTVQDSISSTLDAVIWSILIRAINMTRPKLRLIVRILLVNYGSETSGIQNRLLLLQTFEFDCICNSLILFAIDSCWRVWILCITKHFAWVQYCQRDKLTHFVTARRTFVNKHNRRAHFNFSKNLKILEIPENYIYIRFLGECQPFELNHRFQ